MPSNQSTPLLGRVILIIEDDPIVALNMIDALHEVGASVKGPIETVADALAELVAGTAFDAALVDAHLKDGSARKVLEGLAVLGKPYILVTGDDNFGLVYSPDAPCVPKPVDMADVVSKLRSLIDVSPP